MPNKFSCFFRILLMLAGLAALMPRVARAQAAGSKTVWGLSGTQVVTVPSMAWIDATAYWDNSLKVPDLCSIVNTILMSGYSNTYPNGAVIDTRGLYNSSSTPGPIMCSMNPFLGLTASPPPTTILLPAANIPVSFAWTLPNNTKISGVGGNSKLLPSGILSGNTVLAAAPTLTGEMIDMGSPGFCGLGCSGVGIEHLVLQGNGTNVSGIVNNWSQDQSYVNDVQITQISNTGLTIGAGAANSGPYSNINFTATTGSSVCVDIEAQTRGLHGVTCIGSSSVSGAAAIYVNASNNTLEDLHFETFWDGVQIGNIGSAVSNVVVSNVTGGTNGSGVAMQNVVHICGPTGSCSAKTANTAVSDTLIFGTRYSNLNTLPPGSTSLQDDMTSTSIPDISSVGLYTLGEIVFGGFSRFSTSPGPTPTWGVGSGTINSGTSCTTPGALYSNTSGSPSSVFVCTYNGSAYAWQPIA